MTNEPKEPKEKKDEDELEDEHLDEVSGGVTPSPGGPVPIPYPNVSAG